MQLTASFVGSKDHHGLNVIDLRQWLIYKPLAVLLSILLVPVISWIGGDSHARPFQASAQTGSVCNATGNSIIQNYCDTQGNAYFVDLSQLESDGVNAYLGLHGLPPSDAHLIYDTGRVDLRDGVRATMYAILQGIIKKAASSRSQHEQTLYNWLQNITQNNEINLYKTALLHFASFQSDPCHFMLDPDLATAYKISYDGTPFCFGGSQSTIFGAPVPNAGYFRAYGLKFSYAAKATTDPNYSAIFADTAISGAEIAGIALAAGGVVGGAVAPVLWVTVVSALDTFEYVLAAAAVGLQSLTAADASAGFIVSGAAVAGTSIVGLVLTPVLIVIMAVASAVFAGIEVVDNQTQLNEINEMSNTLAQVTNTPLDMATFLSDSSGLGAYKLENSFYSQTVPDAPSTAALPVHQPATDLSFLIVPKGSATFTVTDTLHYQDWNTNTWSAQTSGGWFVETCAKGASSSIACQEPNSLTGDLRYVDWSGVKWIATRIGSTFASTKGSPASTDVFCPADEATGVTNPGDFSKCVTYVSTSLPMLDQGGNPVIVSLTQLAAPTFADPGPLTFSPGTPATRIITALGNPAPGIVWNSGLGGNHFNFPLFAGSSFTLSFDGSLSATPGNYTLQLTASSTSGTVTQSFPVTIATQLNIISPSTISGTAGYPLNFTVRATGIPTPKLSLNPGKYDMGGLTFTDNGDGSGTLSGVYQSIPSVQTCLVNCGIVATNSQGTVTQLFTLNMASAPVAQEFPPTSVTFTSGVDNSRLLTSFGAITPVTWAFRGDPNAPWLTLVDNGNGTANLHGMPPAGITGTFTPFLGPAAAGTIGVLTGFPVTVTNHPVFTSGETATFTAGTQGSFPITASTGSITSGSILPAGLSFTSGNPAMITGTPAAGTGGQYDIAVTANAATSATQELIVNVNDATQFTSPNMVVMFAGHPASFAVTTSGNPGVSTHAVPANSGPPTSPAQGNGTYFTVSGLPPWLQSSNLNTAGLSTGALTLSGTPGQFASGSSKLQLTAQNAVGSPAQQTLTLQVFQYNPTVPVNLISNWALSRDANNNVIATVVVANGGSTAAQNVGITSAKIGAVAGTVSPSIVSTIGPASTATFKIAFPAASIGTAGSPGSLSLSGAYTGGTFNTAGRIVLP